MELPSELDTDGKLRWIFDAALASCGGDRDSVEQALLGFIIFEAEHNPAIVERFQAYLDAQLEEE